MCVLHLPRMHPIAPTISPWLQVPSSSWGYHSLMFLAAEFAPRLAALLVTSGHLQAMTEAVEGLDASLVPDMVSGSAPASASPSVGSTVNAAGRALSSHTSALWVGPRGIARYGWCHSQAGGKPHGAACCCMNADTVAAATGLVVCSLSHSIHTANVLLPLSP